MYPYISITAGSAITLVATVSFALADDFVLSRPASPNTDTLVLDGRRVQDPSKWPATFKFGSGGRDFCTATAIGSRVILTAAHCLPKGGEGRITVANKQITVICDPHPSYTPCPITDAEFANPSKCPEGKSTSADYELCITDSDLGLGSYEKINKNSSIPSKESPQVLLTGYGCSDQGDYGFLFEGDTKAISLPGDPGGELWASSYIITKGGAALCYGDSGGPSYKYFDDEGKSRVMIGVNSRSYMHANDLSYLSATSEISFAGWAEKWKNKGQSKLKDDVKICGIDSDLSGCHP